MTLCAVLAAALFVCGAPVAASAEQPVRQEPVLALNELQERLETGTGPEFSEAILQATRLGPDYAWLLGYLLGSDISTRLMNRICRALARNGDTESLSILRAFLLNDLDVIEYTESPDVSHVFTAVEFREICYLLQSGAVVDAQDAPMAAVPAFRLKDGTERTARTDGRIYGGISGRVIVVPLLMEFVWERLGRGLAR